MKHALWILLMLWPVQDSRPLPARAKIRQAASRAPWGQSLKQIPSTVITTGVLRDIPYTSYRAGERELNVYGDPLSPAAFELGLHGALLKSEDAKAGATAFVQELLAEAADREALASLQRKPGKKVRAGWTFEVTPPEAPDAYGGWWISVYDEALLDRSRASAEELEKITTSRQEVARTTGPAGDGPRPEGAAAGRWSGEDLGDARKPKDVPEAEQKVYAPAVSKKDGKYVPDRTVEDTGWILFICANSDKHEDREEIVKTCPSCKKESTFFWEAAKSCFVCFQCGEAVDNALIKCSGCGKAPRRVRTKHR